MSISTVKTLFSRALLLAAGAAMLLALAEAFLGIFGLSLIGRLFTPGRLMELAATLVIFVIAGLLIDIRDELRRR